MLELKLNSYTDHLQRQQNTKTKTNAKCKTIFWNNAKEVLAGFYKSHGSERLVE